MTMKEKDSPKLTRRSSKSQLQKTPSKLVVDTKIKTKLGQKAAAAKASIAEQEVTNTETASTEIPKDGGEPQATAKSALEGKLNNKLSLRAKAAKANLAEKTNESRDAAATETPSGKKKEVTFSDQKTSKDGTDVTAAETPRSGDDGEAEPLEEGTEALIILEEEPAGQEEGDEQTKDGNEKAAENADKAEGEKKEEADKEKEEKKGKKGKKKGKGKKDKKEAQRRKEEEKKKTADPVGEVTAGKEEFRTFIFEKVQNSLDVVCTDGVTEVNVDNVMPLLKSMNVDTSDEGILDLIRDSLVDNFGEIVPLELDSVVQKAQEAKELTEMDDCLEVAFKLIDFDEDGFITQPDIYQLMLRLGEVLGEYALDDMLEAVDMDKDGKISLRDFRHFLLGRDVPSRKEIFAMAEEARKKRETEEEEQKLLEGQQQAQQQRELELQNGDEITAADQSVTDNVEPPSSNDKGDATADTQLSNVQLSSEDVPASKIDDVKVSPPDGTESETKPGGGESEMRLELPKDGVISAETNPRSSSSPRKGDPAISEKRRNIFGGGFTLTTPSAVDLEVKEQPIPQLSLDESKTEPASPPPPDGDDDHLQVHSHDNTVDSDFDIDNDSNRGGSPMPVGLEIESIHLHPPDLSSVEAAAPSPVPTPLCSPRRRPTIVSIGGLAVPPINGEELNYAEAIEILQHDMMYGDNPVPRRSRRRHSSVSNISNVEDPLALNTVEDVEDFNNRLVFKLPPRRKSSTTPPVLPISPRPSISAPSNRATRGNKQVDYKSGLDSDEGIDLADEEIIDKSVYVACSAQPPATSLRISMPTSDAEPWEDDSTNKPGITIDLHDVDGSEGENDSSRLNTQREGKHALGVGLASETPRSTCRSEFSGMHVSLTSPRSDESSAEDDEENEEYNDRRTELAREGRSSRAMFSAASNQSLYEADADSVLLSLNDGGSETNRSLPSKSILKRERLSNDLHLEIDDEVDVCDSPKSSDNLMVSPTRQRKTKTRKRAGLSCQTIELKELELNSPVTADQFSNRRKFGMIPRDVSKFLVLGKSSKIESPRYTNGSNRPPGREKINPTIRWDTPRRPQTAAVTSRERNVLQNRRINLMQDEYTPLYDQQRFFDFPCHSTETLIEVPSAEGPETPLVDRVRDMETRILKRTKSSYELPSVGSRERTGSETCRSESSRESAKWRAQSATTRKPLYKRISVIDLTKGLRKDATMKNNALLTKRHSGFKSIVPLTRVVMAYQTAKKRRQSGEFYSISRQLEKRGVPYHANSAPVNNSYITDSHTKDKKKKKGKKSASKRSSSYGREEERDTPKNPLDDDVPTLVGDLKDPDIIPNEVVFEKVRPFTAHPMSHSSRHADRPRRNEGMHPGTRAGSGIGHSSSSAVTIDLRLPDETMFEKKLKNVSMLSRLPIK